MENKPVTNMVGVIDDGTKEYKITNNFGATIATIHFNPNDIRLIDRLNKMQEDFKRICVPISQTPDDASFEEKYRITKSVEEQVKRSINAVFVSDDVASIFDRMSPLSVVNGQPFFFTVLSMLTSMVESEISKETELAKSRTSKYLEDLEK